MALVLSSTIYALAHFMQNKAWHEPVGWLSGLALLPRMFDNGPPLIPAAFTLFMAGAILAFAYQRTGTLFLSMGLHAGWIFWLKSYGFLTVKTTGASTAVWGTDKLVDGWLPLFVLCVVFWIVSRLKFSEAKPA
jgi:membrane protease YdiL (CAAX protease family)